jgi:hypothetical protein
MNDIVKREGSAVAIMEKLILGGDLKALTPGERLNFYNSTCQSLGLNPLTRPFEYITLNGKLTLYARKDATEQLRNIHGVSVTKLEREVHEGIFTVTAYLEHGNGRKDSSIGAVSIEGLKGEAKANAMMKAETKAKRRGTLSICGLGLLDETEIETIPDAKPFHEDQPKDPKKNGVLEEIKLAFKSAGLDKEENKGVRFGTLQACFRTKKWSDIEAMDLNTLLDCLTILKDRLGIKREGTPKPPVDEVEPEYIPGTNSQQEVY